VAPLSISEVVEGSGKLCGGAFIDEAFEHMCKRRLGRRWDRLSRNGIREILRGAWEQSIKPQFQTGNPKKEYIVQIPAEAFQGDAKSLHDTTELPHIKQGRIHFREYVSLSPASSLELPLTMCGQV